MIHLIVLAGLSLLGAEQVYPALDAAVLARGASETMLGDTARLGNILTRAAATTPMNGSRATSRRAPNAASKGHHAELCTVMAAGRAH
jgi:hypothetical protein